MNPVVIRPSSWLTTGIRVETINNLSLFKFTPKLSDRMNDLLQKKKLDALTPEEAAELEGIGELDMIFSYINATIAAYTTDKSKIGRNNRRAAWNHRHAN